jgi:hypothetical protein
MYCTVNLGSKTDTVSQIHRMNKLAASYELVGFSKVRVLCKLVVNLGRPTGHWYPSTWRIEF